MSLFIYFLRHGVTTASQAGGYCGTLDPDLTPVGYQMAEDFTDAYESLPWVAVFSSPLRRAIATAKPLCEAAGIPNATQRWTEGNCVWSMGNENP